MKLQKGNRGRHCRWLVGQRFQRLTVIKYAGRRNGRPSWLCKCACGNEIAVITSSLICGNTASCGCLSKETRVTANTTHGMTKIIPEYAIWAGIRRRCNSAQDKRYHRYGGRGIKVCERWDDFTKFYADMGPRPSLQHSIERINNDGNYEPGNCKWATRREQYDNTSLNKPIAGFPSISAAARALGIQPSVINARLRRGWPLERALTPPKFHRAKKAA